MPKNIFLIPLPPPYAGPERIAEELIQSETMKNRTDITVINSSIKQRNKDKGKFGIKGLWRFLKIYIRFVGHLSGAKYVFMYLSSGKIGFLRDSFYILTCWLFRKKCVAQYHGSFFGEFYANQKPYYQKWIRFSLNKLTLLLVLGENLKSIFSGCYSGKIEVLHNGLNTSQISPKPKTKNNEITLLFMGHLWYPKGFYDLILAYKKVHEKYGNRIKLQFAGERTGYQKGAIEFLNEKWREIYRNEGKKIAIEIENFIEQAEKFNAEYLGFISGKRKETVLQNADLFILPSYTEGFSMSCLEALAFGLPVITTPVGAMPEMVKHQENGLLVPIGNPAELEKAIELLKNNKDLYQKISAYNPDYVKNNFDIEQIANRLLKIITKNS